MKRPKKKISPLGHIILFFVTGGLWLIIWIVLHLLEKPQTNMNKSTRATPKFDAEFTFVETYNKTNSTKSTVEKKSKPSNLFTKKWSEAACKEFIALDFETTGLIKNTDYIITSYADGLKSMV